MDKRTTGLIATIATALLCGCPGLFLCFFGAATALGGGSTTLGDTTRPLNPTYGYVFLCLSLILIAIPIVVGVVTLRTRPGVVAPVAPPPAGPASPIPPIEPVPPSDDEPLPPAS
jgi:hypothetical protein